MKKVIVLLTLFLLFAYGVEKAPRRAVLSKESDRIEEFEIVMGEKTPLLDWTCKQFQAYLKRATGYTAEIVEKPSGKRFAIIVGDCDAARKAGIDVNSLPEEGHVILRKGDRLFLAGRDSKTNDPLKNDWMQRYERASLSACYDFLERFAGAKFVFPGEFGTVIPERKGLLLPKEIDIMERPDLKVRTNHIRKSRATSFGAFDTVDGVFYINQIVMMGRWSEFAVPFIHGLAHIDLVERFKDTHPEYFALLTDGRRHIHPDIKYTGHLCFSNKEIREVIYQDVKAFLTGRPAKERGIEYWRSGSFCGKYASVMPHDAFYWCNCEECAKIARGGNFCNKGFPLSERQKAADAINDVIWRFTKEIAERLTKEGIDGSVTQMAYHPSKEPPDFRLPDNIEIQVATDGLGHRKSWEENRKLLQRWKEKTGKSLSLWTYPGKHMGKAAMVGIPAMMHHQMGEYFQYLGDSCCGAFIEEETDYAIFNFLNEYVFSRVSWNLETDVEKLLDEMYAAMFGDGAQQMKLYFDTLEHLWCDRILGNVVQSELGPVDTLPTVYEVWRSIYSPEQMKAFEELFDKAEANAAKDAGAVGRIRYLRKNFHGPIVKACEEQKKNDKDYGDWTLAVGETAWLHSRFWEKTNVRTSVTVMDEGADLVFSFYCEEPDMDGMVANISKETLDGLCHEDSDVEIFLNPSGDRKNYYQIVTNSNGALFDGHAVLTKMDTSWNSGAKVVTERGDGFWKAVIKVPKSAIGAMPKEGMPLNFARHMVINGKNGKFVDDYQWTLSTESGFSDIGAWGRLIKHKPANLLSNGDFEQSDKDGRPLDWRLLGDLRSNPDCKVSLDTKEFITGGQSLRFDTPPGGRLAANQKYRGKPHTKYRLSFYLKTENVVPSRTNVGAGAWIESGGSKDPFPSSRVYGTTKWMRHETVFETGDGGDYSIGLWNWFSSGTVWYDHVKLEEIVK